MMLGGDFHTGDIHQNDERKSGVRQDENNNELI